MALTEKQASLALEIALVNGQAAELLNALFEGDGFTVDPVTKRIIIIPQALIQQAVKDIP